jgi:transposase InsO family protein
VFDRDPRFTGKFFVNVCRLLGVKHSFSSAYHPQTDGQTERSNRVLEDVLRHYSYVELDGRDWNLHLSIAEFAVNCIPWFDSKRTVFPELWQAPQGTWYPELFQQGSSSCGHGTQAAGAVETGQAVPGKSCEPAEGTCR